MDAYLSMHGSLPSDDLMDHGWVHRAIEQRPMQHGLLWARLFFALYYGHPVDYGNCEIVPTIRHLSLELLQPLQPEPHVHVFQSSYTSSTSSQALGTARYKIAYGACLDCFCSSFRLLVRILRALITW